MSAKKNAEKQAKLKQEELNKRGAEFEKEYQELVKKHGIRYVALCDFHNVNGITPVLRTIEVPKEEEPKIIT